MTTVEELERRLSEIERRIPTTRPARRWEWYEERISALGVRLGAGAPTAATRQFGATSGVLAPTLDFSSVTNQLVEFVWHAPEDLNSDMPAYIHVMWIPGASWTAGNYSLSLEFIVKAENGTVGAGATTNVAMSVTPANGTTLIETEFSAYPITIGADQMLSVRFYRNTLTDNGDDVLQLLFIEIEYARWLDGRRPDVPMELCR